MKAWPIRRRFSCGSVTPASAARNWSSALTTCRSVLKWSVNSAITDSASSLRSRPLSTRMHESCGPMAWASSAATTDESTPPESPQITRPLPTRRRIASIVSRAKSPSFHVPVQRQTALQEVAQDLRALRRVRHLGMELQAVDRQLRGASPRRSGRCRWRPAAGNRRRPATPGRRGSSRPRSPRARRRTARSAR